MAALSYLLALLTTDAPPAVLSSPAKTTPPPTVITVTVIITDKNINSLFDIFRHLPPTALQLALPDFKHLSPTYRACALSRRPAVFHGYSPGILHFPLGATLHTISLHRYASSRYFLLTK